MTNTASMYMKLARDPEVVTWPKVAVVVVISVMKDVFTVLFRVSIEKRWRIIVIAALCFMVSTKAGVLPEDRGDAMYHRYQGGGVTVDGPALLVRKDFADKVSLSASYYHDSISAASPDIFIAGASPYEDSRDEFGMGIDYIYDQSLMSFSYSYGDESDYTAKTLSAGISHDMFDGLTTISMGFSRGWDDVTQNGNPLFDEQADHYRYKLGLSQVVSKDLLFSLSYEGIADSGFLRSPYRKALLQGAPVEERYPRTRTGNAASIRFHKYWLHRASSYLSYRFYTDTWDVIGHTTELGYSQYIGSRWLVDVYYRYYSQSGASFYNNNFDQQQNFMARDKELSTFMSNGVGTKITYSLFENYLWFDSGSLNLAYEYMRFNYDDYTAENPLINPNADGYSFDPYSFQVFFSTWF